jgi:exosome complex component RRP43
LFFSNFFRIFFKKKGSAHSTGMNAEAFRKLYPAEYLRKFVSQGVRPDGRKLQRFRKASVAAGTIGTASGGSAFVKLGNTSVLCGVRAELGAPSLVAGAAARVVVNVDLPPLCSPKYRSSGGKARLPEEATVAAQRLNALLADCAVVSPEQLAFDPDGRLCWYLAADVYVLDADGAVYDAMLISLLAALTNTKLCRGTVDDTGSASGGPVVNRETEAALVLERHPVASTFAVFDQDAVLLVDPTAEEEALQTASITVTCDETGTICEVHKPGGAAVQPQTILACATIAAERAKTVLAMIKK